MRKRSFHLAFLLSLLLIAVHLLASGPLNFSQRALGSIPGVLSIWAGFLYLDHGLKLGRLPFLEFGLVQIYLFFGLHSIIGDGSELSRYHSTTIDKSLIATALFSVLLWAGSSVGVKLLIRPLRNVPRKLLPKGNREVYPVVMIGWIGLAAIASSGMLKSLPQALQMLGLIVLSYIPIMAYVAYRSNLVEGRFPAAKMYFLGAFFSLVALPTGMMESIIQPFLVVGALQILFTKRIPVGLGFAVALLAIALQPIKIAYRSIVWSEGQSTVTNPLDIVQWREAIKMVSEDNSRSEQGNFVNRINELGAVSTTFEQCPFPIPHDFGQVWAYIPLSPIPRIVWTSKPDFAAITNHRFNITFGIQTPEQTTRWTSRFPILSDAYWNFGWFGIAGVSLVLGAMLGLMSAILNQHHWGALTFGIALLVSLRVTAAFAWQFNALFQTFVGFAIVCWFITILAKPNRAKVERRARPKPLASTSAGRADSA